jgi:hypothetical protein
MIVKVKPSYSGGWRTWVMQGCQYFTIAERPNKEDALWMAKMFKIALKNHNNELLKKTKK